MRAMAPLEFDWMTSDAKSRQGVARRRGFTIVEIMTVVAIIMILVGIAAIAYKTLDNPSSGSSTKITLQNLQGQLAEYEAAAGLRNQPADMWKNGARITQTPTTTYNIWQEPAVMPILPDTTGNVSSGGSGRYNWDAVANTQRVYQILAKIPANKQSMQRLPSRQVHGRAEEASDKLLHGTSGDPIQLDPPLVLDAWGNPIIFVGSQGLKGVYVGKKPNTYGTIAQDFDPPRQMIVTSAGTIDPKITTAIPAGVRPFFASAGPDGNFHTGDDNVYSFSQ